MSVAMETYYAVAAVKECGSFTGAARDLNKSQAAVSMAIQSLEAQLGYSLFVRSSKGITTTPRGERYYNECKRFLDDHRRFVDAIELINEGDKDVVNIGIDRVYSTPEIAEVVESLIERFHDLNINICFASSDVLYEWHQKGKIDFALGSFPQASLQYLRKLYNVNWVLVRRALVVAGEVSYGMTKVFTTGDGELIEQEAKGLKLRNARVDDLHQLIALCRKGIGNIYLPYHHVEAKITGGELSIIHNVFPMKQQAVNLLFKPSAAGSVFGECFMHDLAGLKPRGCKIGLVVGGA